MLDHQHLSLPKMKEPSLAGMGCYRGILKRELEIRKTINSAYSLRSFARDLNMSPANLSQIFSGKNGISPTKATEISQIILGRKSDRDWFCSLVAAEHSRSKAVRTRAQKEISRCRRTRTLELEKFKTIEDWYHFPILELVKTRLCKSVDEMANYLSLPSALVQTALGRLVSLGVLTKNRKGYKANAKALYTKDDIPSDSIKRFHVKHLDRARIALYKQPLASRDFSTSILAIRKDRLEEAKKALRDFKRDFNERFAESSEGDAVYCLSAQFYYVRLETDNDRSRE